MLASDVQFTPRPPRWLLKPVPEGVDALASQAQVPALIALLLAQRDITPAAVRDFLVPRLATLGDPFDLPEMRPLVDRLLQAADRGEKVLLYGDYDVDGVTSLSIMHLALRAYGLTTDLYLPHRLEEGYGLSLEGLQRAFDRYGVPDLLVALDCGTTSIVEVASLKEKGIDCVIVDHHELSPEGRPDCIALVNPRLGDTHHYFCTAGLAFKVAHALMKARRIESFDLKSLLDLLALEDRLDVLHQHLALELKRQFLELQHRQPASGTGHALQAEIDGGGSQPADLIPQRRADRPVPQQAPQSCPHLGDSHVRVDNPVKRK